MVYDLCFNETVFEKEVFCKLQLFFHAFCHNFLFLNSSQNFFLIAPIKNEGNLYRLGAKKLPKCIEKSMDIFQIYTRETQVGKCFGFRICCPSVRLMISPFPIHILMLAPKRNMYLSIGV